MSWDAARKPLGKSSHNAYTKVIQPKTLERRSEVRRVVHERYPVVATVTEVDTGNEIKLNGIITDVSEHGIGLVLETESPNGRVLLAPHVQVKLTIAATIGEGSVRGAITWSSELPTKGKVLKVNPRKSFRCGVLVGNAHADDLDYMRKLVAHTDSTTTS